MKPDVKLYLAATALQEAYIRLHPELGIVTGRIVGHGRRGSFTDDGAGTLALEDMVRDHAIIRLDLTPWMTPPDRGASSRQ
jgi:hypothetical protein